MSTARLVSVSGGGGVAVVRGRVQIPAWGLWWADLDTESAVEDLVGGDSVQLEAGDVTLTGTVVTGGPTRKGRGAYRIVAGAGGWSTSIEAKSYHDTAGVSRAAVIADAARAAGESVSGAPTTRVSSHYARSVGPASRVLHDLSSRAWYVGLDGVTYFGARESVTYDGDATRTAVKPAADVIEVAVRSGLATWVPGVSVDTVTDATDVEWIITPKRLTVRVYGGSQPTRELDAFRRIFDAIDPRRAYRAAYEFRVVTQDGDLLNLQPVRASAGMPDLEQVPVRLSPGVEADHQLGSLVTVIFLDGDPSRPRVISGDDAGAPGWMPTSLTLGDSTPLGVARIGDSVVAGPYAGTITSGSTTIKAGG